MPAVHVPVRAKMPPPLELSGSFDVEEERLFFTEQSLDGTNANATREALHQRWGHLVVVATALQEMRAQDTPANEVEEYEELTETLILDLITALGQEQLLRRRHRRANKHLRNQHTSI